MNFTHQRLICVDCMNGYLFPAEEQQAHADAGQSRTISRCPDCTTSRAAIQAARAAAPVVASKRRY